MARPVTGSIDFGEAFSRIYHLGDVLAAAAVEFDRCESFGFGEAGT